MPIDEHWRGLSPLVVGDAALVEALQVEAIDALHAVDLDDLIIEEVLVGQLAAILNRVKF